MACKPFHQPICSWAPRVVVSAWIAVAPALPLVVTVARGQDSSAKTLEASADPRHESLTKWQYYVEIPLAAAGGAERYDVLVTPPVFDAARQDLGDLRLYDANDNEVPYALRVREKKSQLANLEAEEFNRLENADGSRSVSLDVGDEEVQHNEVEILTTGSDFRRKAVIEGSDDRSEWNQIDSESLLNFRRDEESFTDAAVEYPPSRFRYLRVTVHPDPQEDTPDDWDVRSITVRRRVELPGEQVVRPVEFGEREAARTPEGPGSQWLIDLGGASVPCRELLVDIESNDFVRDWRIEAAGPDRPGVDFYFVASGVWQRKAGEAIQPLEARLPREIRAARLKLLVTDNRNSPLEITSMRSRAPARQIVVAASEGLQGPLRLYFGNPDAESPRYDFARNLPERLTPAPHRLELGQRQFNPVYQPKPKPLTERLPWLVHTVLAGAVVVLASLIADLGRAALKPVED